MPTKKTATRRVAQPSLLAFSSKLVRSLLSVLILAVTGFAEPSFAETQAPTPVRSYSFGDVLFQSAIGKSEAPFTPLSLSDFGRGWLEPWIPPPNGELHLQRGGWVNTAGGFFSRELDPSFTFNAGTAGSREE